MKRPFFALLLCLFFGTHLSAQTHLADSLILRRLHDSALVNGRSYLWLHDLCKGIGGRLSGSPQAEEAVTWSKRTMQGLGFDSVRLQEVMVPHWVRGAKERCTLFPSHYKKEPLSILALGGSKGTGGKPLRASVIEVHSLDTLKKLGKEKLEGKIVFFNRPMEARHIETFEAYGGAGDQRWGGSAEAAKYGAVGVLVRSLTLALDDHPHTGGMRTADSIPTVPAAAISTAGANRLSQILKMDPESKVEIQMDCQTLPDVKSYNVIGEIRGSEKPDEIILVGGHLDSWDNGEGAHDDGAGVVQSMEALRLFRACGIRPKRTLRVVLFMNEENGLRGGRKYAEEAKRRGEKHICAIESDEGGFAPRGFSMTAKPEQIKKYRSWAPLFRPFLTDLFLEGGGGADISPLRKEGVAVMGLLPDSQRYFDVHHASTDVFETVHKRELELGAASLAGMLYLLSEYGL